MQCLQCRAVNRDDRRFCAECGEPLGIKCGACGFQNEPGARFCGGCGSALAAPSRAGSGADPGRDSAPISTAGGDRRQVTILFCDLVGSTALSKQLDPEELREMLGAYRETCSAVVDRFEGYVHGYVGDGIVVYFGYPRAHEEDATRAVWTGLGIVEAMGQLNERVALKDGRLAVRVGINTGLVVAGDIGSVHVREEKTVVGDAPNVAARIQELASPNTVVISESTRRLVDGQFVCDPLPTRPLKGISEPLTVYRVGAPTAAHSRFEVSAERGLTPMVGRLEEIGLLVRLWGQARDGEGLAAVISGEAGIGKSRVLRGLRNRLRPQVKNRINYDCSPFHANSALYPVIDQIERALNFTKADSGPEKRVKLEAALSPLQVPVPDALALIGNLLSLPDDERYPMPDKSPQQLRKLTLDALLATIMAYADREPLMMVVEDAQWIDPTSLELLTLLAQEIRSHPIFLIITCRPEFLPSWREGESSTLLSLSRLSRAESEQIITKVSGGRGLPEEVIDEIVAKTDGVPLFIEELTKTVLESDLLQTEGSDFTLRGPLPPLAIPTTLHDSLMARLDRLLPVKRVAQLAATLGRTFSEEILSAVAELQPSELRAALTKLVDAGLVYQVGKGPEVSFEFKHALVRDAAYQSLLKSTRQQYHTRIAQVLRDQNPQISETRPELIAHHYTEAGLALEAIAFWERAGHQASERSANLEAVAHLSKGIEIVRTLPDAPESKQTELDLLISLNGPVIAAKGYSAPELERNFTRALDICREIGETAQIFPVMYANWVFDITTGKIGEGKELAAEFLDLAEQRDDNAGRMMGHRLLGPACFISGDFVAARTNLEQGIDLYDPDRDRPLAVVYGQDAKTACLYYLALSLWQLGLLEQAQDCGERALEHAAAFNHAHTQGSALGHAGAFLSLLNRNSERALTYAREVRHFAGEHQLPVWAALGGFYEGWALAQNGEIEGGIAAMEEGLAGLRRINFTYWQPLILACLAEAHGQAGSLEQATQTLNEAFEIVQQAGERWLDAELWRIRGDLLARGAEPSEAEADYRKALQIARDRDARSQELRAAMGLARLLHEQGRGSEARDSLDRIYSAFTEGSDFADLADAKALLDQLS